MYKYKISIITATYNAAKTLPNLIKSLQAQYDSDFEWVIADGGSTDATLEILKSVKNLNLVIHSEPDFGIYDALNKGIKSCSGEYYLVLGADDLLFPNGIQDYKNAIDNTADIITAAVKTDAGIYRVKNKSRHLEAMGRFISCHAVGALIKTNLHNELGFYSSKYPIAADQLFILNACNKGAKVKQIPQIVGEYSISGLSGQDTLGYLSEVYRIQVATGQNKYIQTLVYFLKIIKNLHKVKRI